MFPRLPRRKKQRGGGRRKGGREGKDGSVLWSAGRESPQKKSLKRKIKGFASALGMDLRPTEGLQEEKEGEGQQRRWGIETGSICLRNLHSAGGEKTFPKKGC